MATAVVSAKRSANPEKVYQTLHLRLLAVIVLPAFRVYAEQSIEHPFIEPKDLKSEACQAQTRSAGNSHCLECYAPKRVTAGTGSPFSLQKISTANLEAIPKVEPDPTLRFGHPRATHPVAEVADLLHGGEKVSYLSCHDPHASTLPNLLVLAKGGGDVSDAWHRAIDKQKEGQLKSQPQAQRTPNLPTQLLLKGCSDWRNSFGGD